MNSSGMLYTDASLLCILVYVFWGGGLVTLAGGVLSIMVMRQPGRAALGVALAIGCLAPLAYAMLWTVLARLAPDQPETSDLLVSLVMAGLAASVFTAPLWALIRVVRPPKREHARS